MTILSKRPDGAFMIACDGQELKVHNNDLKLICAHALGEYLPNSKKATYQMFSDTLNADGIDITAFTHRIGSICVYWRDKPKPPGGYLKLGGINKATELRGRAPSLFIHDIDTDTDELPVGIRKLISARLSKLNPFKHKDNKGLTDEMIIADDIQNRPGALKQSVIEWAEKYMPISNNDLKKHSYMNHLDPYKGAFIRTLSGLFIDIQFPTAEMIDIEDIAHGLAGEFRFGKQTKERYTVAQHCVEMSRRAPFKLQLTALLHDAPEFVMGDMTKPLKILLDDYKRLENGLMKVIAQKYGIEFPFDPEIKRLDTQLLEWEYKNLFLEPERYFMVMSPPVAKAAFLKRFHELTAGK